MKTRIPLPVCSIFLVAGSLLVPQAASAYIGPGAGLSVIGTVVAFLAAVLLAVVGFVWYPIKRVLRKRRAQREGAQQRNQADPKADSAEDDRGEKADSP